MVEESAFFRAERWFHTHKVVRMKMLTNTKKPI